MGCLGGVGANGLTREAISRSLEVREYCRLDDGGRSLLRSAMYQLQMSARAFHRILKLARTIGDLAGEGDDHHRTSGGGYPISAPEADMSRGRLKRPGGCGSRSQLAVVDAGEKGRV